MQIVVGEPKVSGCSAHNGGWIAIRVKRLLPHNGARAVCHFSDRPEVVHVIEIARPADGLSIGEELSTDVAARVPRFTSHLPIPDRLLSTGYGAALNNLHTTTQGVIREKAALSCTGVIDFN